MENKSVNKLIKKHPALVHSESMTVVSHVQRMDDDWYINTIMLKGVNTPFKYKRKTLYKSLEKSQVNLTYYPATELIAGFEMEVMNVVRIKVS